MDRIHYALLAIIAIFASLWNGTHMTQKYEQNARKLDHELNLLDEPKELFYKAGVVEYKPVPIGTQSPLQVMLENIKCYEALMEQAANHSVDIIVFPEYGITTLGMPSNRITAREFLIELPELGVSPCENNNDNAINSVILGRLSCASKNFNMYTVVNLGEIETCNSQIDPNCPSDGAYQYNTNVVFDRQGSIIAKYRKYHLYFEPIFNTPPLEHSTFMTDFGVEFGLFTCFDIIFAHPVIDLVDSQNIRNFIYPTAWVDELPFLTAIQAQSLWAQSNQANLLASGYHHPERGSLGSGIYSGYHHAALNYTFNPSSGTKLIVSSVPKNPQISLSSSSFPPKVATSHQKEVNKEENVPYHMWLREDLSNYTHKPINPNLNEDTLCHLDTFCCKIEYNLLNVSENTSGQLKFVVFEGRRTVAAKTDWFEWQVCAVLHCHNETLESCTENNYEQGDLDRHPKFNRLNIHVQPVKSEFKENVAETGLSLLDTQFNLIPQYYFNMTKWTDSENGFVGVTAESKGEHDLHNVNLKTVSVIQRIYKNREQLKK